MIILVYRRWPFPRRPSIFPFEIKWMPCANLCTLNSSPRRRKYWDAITSLSCVYKNLLRTWSKPLRIPNPTYYYCQPIGRGRCWSLDRLSQRSFHPLFQSALNRSLETDAVILSVLESQPVTCTPHALLQRLG